MKSIARHTLKTGSTGGFVPGARLLMTVIAASLAIAIVVPPSDAHARQSGGNRHAHKTKCRPGLKRVHGRCMPAPPASAQAPRPSVGRPTAAPHATRRPHHRPNRGGTRVAHASVTFALIGCAGPYRWTNGGWYGFCTYVVNYGYIAVTQDEFLAWDGSQWVFWFWGPAVNGINVGPAVHVQV